MYQQSNYNNYYPQPQNQYMRPPQPAAILKGRMVSSIEEAKASSIDFDGSIFYFPDLANKRIYTKQINMDGTATLNVYELKFVPESAPTAPSNNNFVTREEFENALEQLKESLIAPKAKNEVPNF